MHPRIVWLRDARVRLIALLLVLALLVAYASSREHFLGIVNTSPASTAAAQVCPVQSAPSVEIIPRARLLRLREGLRRVVFFERGLRPYEFGLQAPGSAWSDSEPGTQASLSLKPRDPGGYEMRWWMPDGDDLVADGMVFANRRQARDFFRRA